jgi:hypothetical protein
MLPYLGDIVIPNDNPTKGRVSSVSATHPFILGEDNMVLGRKEPKLKKATANGFYTVGTNHFKIRKGKPIPAEADEVFYDNQEPVVTAGERFARVYSERGSKVLHRESEETVDDDSAEDAVEEDGGEEAVEDDGAEQAVEDDGADEAAVSPPAKKRRGRRAAA